MSVNKVVFGTTVLVDLTQDTITPATVAKGYKGHDKAGNIIVGTLEGDGTGTGKYIWKKYNVVTTEESGGTWKESTKNLTSKPSDVNESTSYASYSSSSDGYFTLKTGTSMMYKYYLPNGEENGKTRKIYRTNSFMGSSWAEITMISDTAAEQPKKEKGDTLIGYISSDNRNEYPDDGEQNNSWYVFIEEGTGGGTTPALQSKTVTPTKSSQTVKADTGYDGLSQVTVNAIPSQYIEPSGTLSITTNGTKDVKSYASVNVNVASSGIDTSDATATAEDITTGKTAYVNGKKITGTASKVEFGSISSTDRSKSYTINTNLKNISEFVIAKYSGNETLGLFSYGYRPEGQGGFSNNGDANGMKRYTDMFSFNNGTITISGSNTRGLLGTYRWIAIGS